RADRCGRDGWRRWRRRVLIPDTLGRIGGRWWRRGWAGRAAPTAERQEPHMTRVLPHDGPRRKVAQPLALAIDEEHDHADAIAIRQEVDNPDHVAYAGLQERQR